MSNPETVHSVPNYERRDAQPKAQRGTAVPVCLTRTEHLPPYAVNAPRVCPTQGSTASDLHGPTVHLCAHGKGPLTPQEPKQYVCKVWKLGENAKLQAWEFKDCRYMCVGKQRDACSVLLEAKLPQQTLLQSSSLSIRLIHARVRVAYCSAPNPRLGTPVGHSFPLLPVDVRSKSGCTTAGSLKYVQSLRV